MVLISLKILQNDNYIIINVSKLLRFIHNQLRIYMNSDNISYVNTNKYKIMSVIILEIVHMNKWMIGRCIIILLRENDCFIVNLIYVIFLFY